MEENRIQNLTKYSLFQLSFWRKHLPNQTRWIARTVMVEENDIDKGRLITKCSCGVTKLTKKPTKFLHEFLP